MPEKHRRPRGSKSKLFETRSDAEIAEIEARVAKLTAAERERDLDKKSLARLWLWLDELPQGKLYNRVDKYQYGKTEYATVAQEARGFTVSNQLILAHHVEKVLRQFGRDYIGTAA